MHSTNCRCLRSKLYAELLSNIRTVTFVATLQTPHNKETRVELAADGAEIFISHEGESASITLPTRMSGGGTAALLLPPAPTKDLTLRLALEERAPGFLKFQNGSENVTPWSASSLHDAMLQCRHCGADLLMPNTVTDWRDLPRDDWADLMDFWHCHKPHESDHGHDELSHTRGYGSANRLSASPGIGFVGISTLLLAEQDLPKLKCKKPIG